ncbi:hypothetical protein [Sorangium sp. So ce204]|uniref:hypothetical protein n=1 Tax=Sorangium sp. So ce204 TaxID=3133288 RepID=UPI003F62FD97
MRNVLSAHRSGFLVLCLALSACSAATEEGEAEEVESISAVQQPAIVGGFKVAAIFIRFKNSPAPTYTINDVRDRLFNDPDSANNFFIEASYGKMNLTGHINPDGDYYGWYTINAEMPTICDLGLHMALGRQAAANLGGYVEANYDNTMHFFNGFPSSCAGAYSSGSHTWYPSPTDAGTYAHELGHSMGLVHANVLNCADSAGNWAPMSTTCAQPNLPWCANPGQLNAGNTSCVQDMGDSFSPVGGGYMHYSAPEKALFGWFNPENTATVSASGTSIVSVKPIEVISTGVQRLVIPIPGGDETYQVEYRQPIGFDQYRQSTPDRVDGFTANAPVARGILVHRGPLEGSPKGIVNMTPSWPIIDFAHLQADASREALPWGHTFVDRDADLAISLLGVSSSEATVKVTRGTAAAPIPACAGAPSHWYLKCGATGVTSWNAATELAAAGGDALELTYQVSQTIANQSGGDACVLVQTHTAGQSDACTQFWKPEGGALASGETKTLSPNSAVFHITYPAPGSYKASLSAKGALSVTPAP